MALNIHIGRSSSHLRLALLPSWIIQGCPSLDNPLVGTRAHWTLVFNQLTPNEGYAFRTIVQTELFIPPLKCRILMQYAARSHCDSRL